MWKERLNGILREATGYQIQHAHRGAPSRGPASTPGPEAQKRAAARKAARVAARKAAREAARKAAAAKPRRRRGLPAQYDEQAQAIIRQVRPRTMTGRAKLFGLISATRYVAKHQVPGDIVECGVWRGGSMQTVALTLQSVGDTGRHLHLFDTFEGMPEPTEKDVRYDGRSAADLLAEGGREQKIWAIASLDDVRTGMAEVAYPESQIHYHQGRVEQTVPDEAPAQIAILRLDTDWYESTRHELEHLYDRLSPGGVLIIDDYGYFEGSRLATDEFLERTLEPLLLIPIDSGRIAVKPWA